MRTTNMLMVAVFLLLIPAAGAVANYSGPTGNGTYHIMSGSSASASTGVTEGNDGGTVLWEAEVAQTGASCRTGNATGLAGLNWSTDRGDGAPARTWNVVSFTGTVTTSTPCHVIDHQVIDRGNGTFVLNVTTEPSGRACIECVGAVTYTASFRAPGDYRLTVMHDGRLVEVLDSPGNRDGERTHQGIVTRILELFLDLLGA